MGLDRLVKAEDLFDSLEHEKGKYSNNIFEVKNNREVDALLEVFRKCRGHEEYLQFLSSYKIFPSAKDIEYLSVVFPRKSETNKAEKSQRGYSFLAGSFLSACINLCLDEEIRINTNNFEFPPGQLGANNDGKKIIISGNVGDSLGFMMNSGEIIVKGNTKDYVGNGMRGGKITVSGSTGRHVGFYMIGGEIHLNPGGGYHWLSKIIGGKIYHNGELIVDKGRDEKI